MAREVAKGERRPDREEESGDAVLGVRVGFEEILDRRVDSECVEEREPEKCEGGDLEPALAGPSGQRDERGGRSRPHECEPGARDQLRCSPGGHDESGRPEHRAEVTIATVDDHADGRVESGDSEQPVVLPISGREQDHATDREPDAREHEPGDDREGRCLRDGKPVDQCSDPERPRRRPGRRSPEGRRPAGGRTGRPRGGRRRATRCRPTGSRSDERRCPRTSTKSAAKTQRPVTPTWPQSKAAGSSRAVPRRARGFPSEAAYSAARADVQPASDRQRGCALRKATSRGATGAKTPPNFSSESHGFASNAKIAAPMAREMMATTPLAGLSVAVFAARRVGPPRRSRGRRRRSGRRGRPPGTSTRWPAVPARRVQRPPRPRRRSSAGPDRMIATATPPRPRATTPRNALRSRWRARGNKAAPARPSTTAAPSSTQPSSVPSKSSTLRDPGQQGAEQDERRGERRESSSLEANLKRDRGREVEGPEKAAATTTAPTSVTSPVSASPRACQIVAMSAAASSGCQRR